ncbi:MAG: 4Fe-4S dicluster domain-containing protein [Desulfosarcina sp.]|nr:4Fe-4S dicluster domain-containing protein [Desulfobacterales bacterium]
MTRTVAAQTRQDTQAVPEPDALHAIQKKIRSCIQCGTCTASCPNEFAMDLTPRRLWRMVLMGETEGIFASQTFTLCSACYLCSLRCPRGLPLTEAMHDLKQMAARAHLARYKPSTAFYSHFMNTIRRHGRIRETEFISRYFLTMAPSKPLLPLSYTGLGFKLFRKGKMSIEYPFAAPGARSLEKIFQKVEAMEESA